jgi:hypothetical protein
LPDATLSTRAAGELFTPDTNFTAFAVRPVERHPAALCPKRCRHSLAKRVGHLVAATLRDDNLELGLEVVLVQAGAALLQMVPYQLAPVVGQLSVQEAVQRGKGFLAWVQELRRLHFVHSTGQVALGALPATRSYFYAGAAKRRCPIYVPNAFCSAFLPRWSRLITVPIGTSRISAISL